MGKRLLIRLETKGIYSVGGEVRREMLSHRHNHEEKVVISNLQRPRRRIVSLDSRSQMHSIEVSVNSARPSRKLEPLVNQRVNKSTIEYSDDHSSILVEEKRSLLSDFKRRFVSQNVSRVEGGYRYRQQHRQAINSDLSLINLRDDDKSTPITRKSDPQRPKFMFNSISQKRFSHQVGQQNYPSGRLNSGRSLRRERSRSQLRDIGEERKFFNDKDPYDD